MPDVELVRDSDGEVVGKVSFDWIERSEFTIENVAVDVPRPLYRFAVEDALKNPNSRRAAGGLAVEGVGIYYEVLEQVMLDAVAGLRGISVKFPISGGLPRRITEADDAPLLEA